MRGKNTIPTARATPADFVASAAHMLLEKVLWYLDVNARPIAGLTVGVDGATVPDRFQSFDAGFHNLSARLTVNRCDKADATSVVLVGGIVDVIHTQMLRHSAANPARSSFTTLGTCQVRLLRRRYGDLPIAHTDVAVNARARHLDRRELPTTTSDAPLTMSPAANTPSNSVIIVR